MTKDSNSSRCNDDNNNNNNNNDNATKTRSRNSSTDDWSSGRGVLPGREVLGPLALMVATPCFSIIFYHVCAHMQGNFVQFGHKLLWQKNGNVVATLLSIWPSPWDGTTWTMIASFLAFQLFLVKYVPGPMFQATVTPMGNVPVYKANGMACYIITLSTLLLIQARGWVSLAMVYDKFGNILSSMNVLAWGLCTLLVIKGHVAPSTTDSGTTGSVIYDFFWGMELYPRIWGWDVKQVTNCRMGMMFWAVAILCFAVKNQSIHHNNSMQIGMAVNVALQLIYITKFFYWEMGYMCSMDIQHDRAGYYLCWGCLVWVPAVYTSHSFYLAEHAPDLSMTTALLIFAMGLACIMINYDADHQRYVFRQTNGNCLIWGKVPKKIVATYYTTTTTKSSSSSQQQQTKKTSLLLVDGWWKYSRHFHYIPEILASVCWSLPALNTALVGPYFYAFYLTILLTDRAYRDDDRCSKKYGDSWKEYCDQVPYKIVPGIL